jgi:DNA helicase IV
MEILAESLKIVSEIEQESEAKLQQVFTGDNETFGGYKYDPELTPYENVKYVIEELSEELATQKERLRTNPNSQKAWLYKINSESLSKIMTDLNKIKNDLIEASLKKALKKLDIKTTEKLDYATTLVYVLLYSRIVGFSKKKTIRYQYCVVDEGQDLSPIEYAVLDAFVIHKRFCILGDLNQGFTTTGLSSWDELNKVFGVDKIKKFELDTNYRSTKPIIDLANKILCPYTNKYLPKSINRKGVEPITKIFDSKESMLKDMEKVLTSCAPDFQKSIGIIVYNSDDFAKLKEIIEKLPVDNSRKIVLESDKRIDYKPQGIYLTKLENCKGLEFADVYLVGRNPLENSAVEEARKSFVGVTRAMDNLNIYYTRK